MSRFLIALFFVSLTFMGRAETAPSTEKDSSAINEEIIEDKINELEKPLYNPFVERYVLDELKQLRVELAAQKAELIQQIVDRQINSIDRGVTYATDTVTYFFYLIAAASSVLVLVGWNSIRDIKDRVHSLADEEIARLVKEYEERLFMIEKQLNQKTRHIKENKEEIELTQEIQSLWLRAGQDNNIHNKITIYDQILKLKPEDCEAITYKADAVLELNEPQWAANLCHQALAIDPENSHAFYQLACAYASLDRPDEAMQYLNEALKRSDTYKENLLSDEALTPLKDLPEFQELTTS
ncbi:TPR end-of-group domain-containing protein [Litoribrevibacter euphylliae]|uniref:TPR end-of-group domain-containing protein n=1 Tax=Litoribrevibacter euphylliae TaxID=1834034 RepID=A0ABV7HIS1_9GAMM